MFSHVFVSVTDFERALRFYSAVMDALDIELRRIRESINAYLQSIALNPSRASAWFNMGGVHWNAGEPEEASRVWKAAVDRFPDHELAALLRRDLPSVLR
ncbi:tetratricopeptide repeat-containing protein [Variovorax paradoxus B4]|uniref:Tetratricopeptide repeat-containing protein n=1 Tax=Variovorax paradoxus B4 TaxID=1246301 RepID=T1X466_VARPD|nr:tetratricopeptide repeat protein [Variovorax paradoxus]AGU47403.1 tetratricopeptide repeat-containing protein [Variovorax paradoxus B4]